VGPGGRRCRSIAAAAAGELLLFIFAFARHSASLPAGPMTIRHFDFTFFSYCYYYYYYYKLVITIKDTNALCRQRWQYGSMSFLNI